MEHIQAYNDNELIFEGEVGEFLKLQNDSDGFLEYIIESRTDDIIEFPETINGDWKFIIK
ncbi:hypothetical protein CIL05_07115 [Virgibacillus profundi]|uniref:Uncharacterized protein n=1 Tax=Virgibacillus profundi TaxID=2024555 RepID=A0A2A2IGG4_9BACI|nr:hypothetical protein [Virgibacillus profundi]PAV30230.1 hypothetical protein CIL05_07115 [Virgibacillus profundi]PXY54402.1 hypothetical protein CIT14_07200 [Virgibacillus profundi]